MPKSVSLFTFHFSLFINTSIHYFKGSLSARFRFALLLIFASASVFSSSPCTPDRAITTCDMGWTFLSPDSTGFVTQCSHKVRFSRTLVRNRTFWSKLVRERSDFALKSPILKAWVNINLSIVQYCFQTVVQLSVISESVHIPSSKLILTGMNTNYLAQSRGAQLCLKSCFKAISSHGLISINFCHI